MKKMKLKTLFIALLFLGIAKFSTAQLYNTGIGARFGWFNGLTIKHFIGSDRAIEGILASRWEGFIITGLYEFQKPTGVNQLDWFIGGGAHIGFWDSNWGYNNDNNDDMALGLDFILGLDYKFEDIPIDLSLDWKPAFNMFGNGFWGDGLALSARFTF